MKAKLPLSHDYVEFVTELKQRIASARLHAARSVNRDLILLYWDIGRCIVERQEKLGWGQSVVEMLSRDLQKAFPGLTGFSAFNLWHMRQLYIVHSSPELLAQLVPVTQKGSSAREPKQILAQLVPEILATIPWGHHVELLKKVKDHKARLHCLRAAAKFGWTRNVLLNQIKARAYERSLREDKTHNFPAVLPEYLAEQAEEALKSSYNLEFLGIRREVKERELEARLIECVQQFILELGYGFCFIGRQYRLSLGKKEFFIDLLFYHRFLKALVAAELKVGSFEPEYAGKMDFYLNLLNGEGARSRRQSIHRYLSCARRKTTSW